MSKKLPTRDFLLLLILARGSLVGSFSIEAERLKESDDEVYQFILSIDSQQTRRNNGIEYFHF